MFSIRVTNIDKLELNDIIDLVTCSCSCELYKKNDFIEIVPFLVPSPYVRIKPLGIHENISTIFT